MYDILQEKFLNNIQMTDRWITSPDLDKYEKSNMDIVEKQLAKFGLSLNLVKVYVWESYTPPLKREIYQIGETEYYIHKNEHWRDHNRYVLFKGKDRIWGCSSKPDLRDFLKKHVIHKLDL